MRKIKCNQCGKFLFSSDKSDGAAGSEAQRLGFVFKMPFLYTGKPGCLFFCCKKCAKEYYKENIPKNPEADKTLEKFRKDIPKMSEELAKGMSTIVKLFKQYKIK